MHYAPAKQCLLNPPCGGPQTTQFCTRNSGQAYKRAPNIRETYYSKFTVPMYVYILCVCSDIVSSPDPHPQGGKRI